MTNRLRNNVDETTAPHFFYLILGVGLLLLVIQNSDADLILAKLNKIGFFGAVSVLVIYYVGFLIDTASWHLTIERLGDRFRRLYDLWKIRMVGEAFNIATPLGTMGGEPVKAALLKTFSASRMTKELHH